MLLLSFMKGMWTPGDHFGSITSERPVFCMALQGSGWHDHWFVAAGRSFSLQLFQSLYSFPIY